ncbi:MAG TPA: beta-ketoacyl synthase N-terminal-like domain-containing protein [Solirubrobacteraceae bacterium]|nr:beta-ketoacyl synthase N-terminal-like domain-containing protein [Solirubrobacteraceae bacterium]
MSGGVAIVGMSCLFPGAPDVGAYWQNIVDKVDAVGEPPPEAWDTDRHYDPDFADSDKVYCRRGGYLGSLVRFDPLAHNIPPVAVGGEPDQWLSLELARAALADAGCGELPEGTRHRTAIVLGKGTYLNAGNALAVQRSLIVEQTLDLVARLQPQLSEDGLGQLRAEMKRVLPPIGAETVAGLIPNIIAGRIANKLDLMGPTYTVDAACASSLVAVEHCIRYLLEGQCDLALAGGAQVWMPVPTLNVFCQLGALSRSEQIRPFDKDADGTLLGEGIGMVVLKRLADATRDGDRIYAVLRSVGIASDGRGSSVMAPRVEGQVLALRRTYEQAGVSPRTVGLLEAHGTGTPAGDAAEIQTLRHVFGERDGGLPHCALGTVKSMISHTIPASGIAGIIKLALALHHRILPPTLHCSEPDPKLEIERTQFYVNTETRPWIHGACEPRRAAINSFGFGGINAHALLEEFVPAARKGGAGATRRDHLPRRDSEVVILGSDSPAGLRGEARRLHAALGQGRECDLTDLAYTCARRLTRSGQPLRLAIVTTSLDDLRAKLQRAEQRLGTSGCPRIKDVSGIFFASQPLAGEGRIALLFPGEGAQYPGMLDGLCTHFPEVREVFDAIDRVYSGHPRGFVPSDYIFPRPAFTEEQRRAAERRLMEMDSAIESVLTANRALFVLLRRLGLRGDVCAGHSAGEYSAAMAGGLLRLDTDRQMRDFTLAMHRHYTDAAVGEVPRAVLLAVGADRERVEAIALEAGGELRVAIDNAPHQTVLVGPPAAADRAREILHREGLIFEQLTYDRAVHTPAFAPYSDPLARIFAGVDVGPAQVPVHSCATTAPYPSESDEIRALLVEQWQRPVEFRATVERLHAEGARLFVEVGPRGNLTAFVEDILRGREFCAMPADVQRRSSMTQLNHLVAMLCAHGVDLDLEYLFAGCGAAEIDWDAPARASARPSATVSLITSWPALRPSQDVVDAVAARPATAPGPAEVRDEDASPASPAAAPVEQLPPAALDAAPDERDAPAPPSSAAEAMAAHLDTMDRFLALDAEVMHAFLGAGPPAPPVAGELAVRVTFDAARDEFLRDHSFGGAVARTDASLLGLAVVPLTMSLDIMAATAARLAPDLHVVGLRDVYARRWVAVDDGPVEVEVQARLLPAADGGRRVLVTLGEATGAGQDGDDDGPAVEAIVLLDAAYPPAPAPRAPDLRGGGASRWTPERIYVDGMFHGPTWRAVRDVRETAPRGVTATLAVVPAPGAVDADGVALTALDVVVLDAAGQAIGLWAAEQLSGGDVIFPYRLLALDVFGPRRPVGEAIGCSATVELDDERTTRSDIDITGGDGALWMTLTGWEDKRFDAPAHLRPLLLGSGAATIAAPWSGLVDGLAGGAPLECRRVETAIASDRAFWLRVWSRRVLGRAERAQFAALRAPDARKLEWLGARTAAKEAVRELLRAHHGLDLLPADILIGSDDRGAPVVGGAWLGGLGMRPAVSLAHAGGTAVAVAGLDGAPLLLGIDIEPLRTRSPGFAAAALGDEERRLLDGIAADELQEWMLRCWCAKEAAAKALGTGLVAGPGSVAVTSIDRERGEVTLLPADALRALHPDVLDVELVVHCVRDAELVAAAAACRPDVRDVATPIASARA